jgi:hypothetical protein
MKGKKVDLIFHNASINLLDDNQTIHQAMAVKNGRIIETGPERQILNKYASNETIDLQQQKVYPSFICPYVPLDQLLVQLESTDLSKAQSENAIFTLIEKYFTTSSNRFISLNIPLKFLNTELKIYQLLAEKYKDKIIVFYSNEKNKGIYKLKKEAFKNIELPENVQYEWILKTIQLNFENKQKSINKILTSYLENGYTTLDIPIKNYENLNIIEKMIKDKKMTVHFYLTEELFQKKLKKKSNKYKGLIIDTLVDLSQQILFAKKHQLQIVFPSNIKEQNLKLIQEYLADYSKDHRWKIIINKSPSNNEFAFYTENNFSILFHSNLNYELKNDLTYFSIKNNSTDPTNFLKLINEQKIIKKDNVLKTLYSQTKWASYQNFEELNLGTLEKNKLANFIVISSSINEKNKSSIVPLQIYAKGKVIYNAY